MAMAITAPVAGQGFLVPNGVTFAGFDGLGYGVNVIHDPTNNYATGFNLDPNGKTPPSGPFVNTFKFDPIVDVGVRVFLVSPNDPIGLPAILTGGYPELTAGNNYVFAAGSSFYVGLYTGDQLFAPPNGLYANPLFGWAELKNSQGAIQLLGGALEFGGGGILAGSATIIPAPEPAAWLICLSGAFALLVFRRGADFRMATPVVAELALDRPSARTHRQPR